MHDEIRRFSLEGEIEETKVVETKERLVSYIENMMRDYNYVPALDIEPQFTLDYNPDKQAFKFELTVYGIQVKKEKAWQVSGMMSGNEIPRYIPKNKSKQLQITAE